MLFYLRIYRFLLLLVTCLLPSIAFELGWHIWFFVLSLIGRTKDFALHGHFGLILAGSFVWIVLAERYKVAGVEELFRERTGARSASSACAATGLAILVISYFSQKFYLPRGLFLICMLTLFVLTVLMRAICRALYRKRRELGKPTRILIVGADEFARAAATKLQHLSFAPCRVAAYVRLPSQQVAIEDCRIYELSQIGVLHSGNGIDEAVIAIHPAQFALIPGIIQALEKLSVPVRAIVDLGEGIVIRERLFQLGRLQMLDLTTTPADSLDYALLKRAFDVCFSVLTLVLALPLLVLIALLIKLSSRGPAFFVQERIGLNGKPFKMYKFRTMRASNPHSNEDGTRWTTRNDPRRTWLGTFLRKSSLDELPQFFNVLKGDMSVVGPRPERPHFVRQFLQEVARYNHRHCLKVGITGWAQVNGWRGDTSINKRIEYDLYYLQNWSLIFDLRIIVMTIFSALIDRNAY
ncbi:MAG TPA: exopolysaccharide biosynthesis polyprenyl glycosylphosphotransferase [Candidatus Acidoferrum sp.]|nr:exopolysaccharide biosynthesis polyprenyl glycosylphosphotransferase [Candidatus Acidoferrum sp.]